MTTTTTAQQRDLVEVTGLFSLFTAGCQFIGNVLNSGNRIITGDHGITAATEELVHATHEACKVTRILTEKGGEVAIQAIDKELIANFDTIEELQKELDKRKAESKAS